ncbi:MAG: EAL domain-containing protein [Rhodobacteraceae bacterium]|nr:EAL domain-containing protein [Paracoccaceae bacterium]
MTTQTTSPSGAAPDRQFVRVTMLVMCVGLIIALSSHLVLERALHWERVASEMALASANEAAAARTVITTADRLTILPIGPESRKTRTRLAWDIERLATASERRTAMSRETIPRDEMLTNDISAVITAGLAIARDDRGAAKGARVLSERIENDILPKLDLIAVTDRAEADLSRTRCLWALAASLLLQVGAGLSLYFLLVRPTRRKIETWVAKSYETDRENRFRLLHDPMTGMPNGAYLHAYISRLALGAERRSTQTAVMRIDFDRFKILREALGTRVADEVIRIAARRVQQCLRGGDFAAYLGQDDFVVVTGDLEDGNSAAAIAGRIQAALTKPFSIRGGARRLSCSIGVTLMSDDEADPDLILANAAIALSEAQAEGMGLIRYFSASQREEVRRRETLYAELVHGLENGEIIAYFQPQIDLATDLLAGFEALVRWRHPKRGLLAPGAFLDFADQTDLTERLGEVVLTRALEAMTAWDAQGLAVPRVGVNFALAQLRNPRLIEKIKWDVERFDVEPQRLAIEVLETVLIKSDADMVVRNLRGLASSGFVIELDDFGTGHASISNLRRFMVNRIKIDRSFILGIETSAEQQQLTASMIAMAGALGIETLAEGIETAEAQSMLGELGCDFGQGYKIAKPMSLEETFNWLRTHCAAAEQDQEADASARVDPNTP